MFRVGETSWTARACAAAQRWSTRFASDRRGAVGVIFAMSALPVLALVAFSLDYQSAIAQRERAQMALDAAVLEGASLATPNPTDEQRAAAATKAFAAAMGRSSVMLTDSGFWVGADGRVNGSAKLTRPSLFGGPFGRQYVLTIASVAQPAATVVRALDVALCVDATGSMYNTLYAVQSNISNFKANLDSAISAAGNRPFERTRVRVIYYRDFGGNGWINLPNYSYYARYYGFSYPVSGGDLGDSNPLAASRFYDMSSSGDVSGFSSFVSGQYAYGGGDTPESGLECLWSAMKSSWTRIGDTLSSGAKVTDVFPVISIYTDAGAHPPNFAASVQNPSYPHDMPLTYDGLLAAWNDGRVIDQKHKALLFYGNPQIEDDVFYGNSSGWQTVRTWQGFSNPASLTSANNSFIASLARGILGGGPTRLTD